MRYAVHIAALLIWILSALQSQGQNYQTGSRRALKQFELARECLAQYDLECVEESLVKAIRMDPGFLEAYRLLAQVYVDQGRLEEAIEVFGKTLEIDPRGHPDAYRLLAGLTIRAGDYGRTMKLLDTFLSFPPGDVREREEALLLKKKCQFALETMQDPVPFEPENLGKEVNSPYSEYWPVLSMDEQTLFFTVMIARDPSGPLRPENLQEDFFFSVKQGEGWAPRQNAGSPLNTADNEGAHTLTADGRDLYFTACNRRSGLGMCDIYHSRWKEGGWSTPRNLGAPVNSRFSEKHPAISADGRRLYFSSNRLGGKGSYDIWLSTKTEGGWSHPVNLGDSVNTPGLEQSPFIHPDQQSLYFSSDGWPGMGQSDLFLCRSSHGGVWSAPHNLGYPINTHNDEVGLSVGASGNRAYFASDRGEGTDTDLYTFELPAESRPAPASYMTGRVYDARNMKGVPASIQLIDLQSEDVVMELQSQPEEGAYFLSLPTGRDYALNVTAEGYLFFSEHFSFSGIHTLQDPYRRDIPLERVEQGSRVVLRNVFFETDAYELLPESMVELRKVVRFLGQNPDVQVEIGGHTDDTGSDTYNQELSQKRAEAVVRYLVDQGVERDRLTSAGYAALRPIADNDSEEGRARNRRTELKIIEAPNR